MNRFVIIIFMVILSASCSSSSIRDEYGKQEHKERIKEQRSGAREADTDLQRATQ